MVLWEEEVSWLLKIEFYHIDLVIFLRDPEIWHDIKGSGGIITMCDTNYIPLATNLATAELLIKAVEHGDMEWRNYT